MTYDEKQLAVTLVQCIQCHRKLYMPTHNIRNPCVSCAGIVSLPSRWNASAENSSAPAARAPITDNGGMMMDWD